MRRRRILAATAAIGLSVAALATVTSASTAASDQSAATTAKTSYVVLANEGDSAKTVAAKLRSSGATVTSVNEAIGLVTVTSTKSDFATTTRGLADVAGVASDRSIGYAPGVRPGIRPSDRVEKEGRLAKTRGKSLKAAQRRRRRRPARLAVVGHGDDQGVQGAPDRPR